MKLEITGVDEYRDGGTLEFTVRVGIEPEPREICIDRRLKTTTRNRVTWGYHGSALNREELKAFKQSLIEFASTKSLFVADAIQTLTSQGIQ